MIICTCYYPVSPTCRPPSWLLAIRGLWFQWVVHSPLNILVLSRGPRQTLLYPASGPPPFDLRPLRRTSVRWAGRCLGTNGVVNESRELAFDSTESELTLRSSQMKVVFMPSQVLWSQTPTMAWRRSSFQTPLAGAKHEQEQFASKNSLLYSVQDNLHIGEPGTRI
jgi:hypothetical protein